MMTAPSPYPLYQQHADLWPLVAPLSSYAEEMQAWSGVLASHFPPGKALNVLDLGSGGGHHLFHLVHGWPGGMQGVAVDLAEGMLARLRTLLPEFQTVQADMTSLRLPQEQRFDLVTVHDSFCYLTELAQVKAFLETVAHHLASGGMALLKLDALAQEFAGPYRYLTTFEDEQQEITLTHYEWDPDPEDSWLEVIYLFFQRRDGRVETREERHRLGLFSRQQLNEVCQQAGLVVGWHELERWDDDRPNPLLSLTKVESRTEGNGRP
jgi:SAM-dependent methyltransferase